MAWWPGAAQHPRLSPQSAGDTKIGLPVCTGYPVEVKRPAAFPLWAGVRLTVQQPIGSMEYVIASIQFIWASGAGAGVRGPGPGVERCWLKV